MAFCPDFHSPCLNSHRISSEVLSNVEVTRMSISPSQLPVLDIGFVNYISGTQSHPSSINLLSYCGTVFSVAMQCCKRVVCQPWRRVCKQDESKGPRGFVQEMSLQSVSQRAAAGESICQEAAWRSLWHHGPVCDWKSLQLLYSFLYLCTMSNCRLLHKIWKNYFPKRNRLSLGIKSHYIKLNPV